MLTTYQTDTQRLLQNPAAPVTLYPLDAITRWINIARGQLAGEGECIRSFGTIMTVAGQRAYDFSSVLIGVAATNGIAGPIHVRDILYTIASGQRKLTPRGWEWFQQYSLNNPVPTSGPPTSWSQYKQGSAPVAGGTIGQGSFYVDPIPDDTYQLDLDCVCYPIPLVDNTTVECIPYLWTDAVPFFAAYYAYLSSQTSARQADAERMFGHYQTFLQRARQASNPSVLRWQYAQSTDPTQLNKIGLGKQAGQQGGG